ncbi:TPA: hypothetical protein ACJJ5M_002040, partial [Neisseria meningitidis]
FHVLDSRLRGNDEILDYGNLSGMIESIEKPQESIRKNRTPPPRHSRAGGNPETQRGRTLSEKTETLTTVIPAQAGIQKRNATGIYQKKQKPHRPSFPQKRESSNTTQQEFIGKNRNPHRPSFPQKRESSNRKTTGIYQQKQKPPPPSFPQKRESRPVGTETYRIKQFP